MKKTNDLQYNIACIVNKCITSKIEERYDISELLDHILIINEIT